MPRAIQSVCAGGIYNFEEVNFRDGVPSIENIRRAAERIGPYVRRTPVFTSNAVNEASGAEVFFKCENLQKAGAFKARGATNAVFSLSDEEALRGVATQSSGNHGAALARAAGLRGIPVTVVMPRNALAIKKQAVAGHGATIVYCEPTSQARDEALARVAESTQAVIVHPFDDPRVIAGQGTAALELFGQVDDIDSVIAPVGGGGLLSGTALAAKSLQPAARVFGAEPRNVDDAWQSLKSGRIMPSTGKKSIADGLLTTLGKLTFRIIRNHVTAIVTVSEESIVDAMRLVWERLKLVIEPSAAVAVAALLAQPDEFQGRRVGIILSGGNVDPDKLPWEGGPSRSVRRRRGA